MELGDISPKDRIKQYRTIRSVCNEARRLRKQVIDIVNYSNQGSEKAADFLNGRNMKYANKALCRAARTTKGVVDPKVERKAILKYLIHNQFQEKLRSAMRMDALENLARLFHDPFKDMLVHYVQNLKSYGHVLQMKEIWQKINQQVDYIGEVQGLSPAAENLVTTGKLSEYLNTVYHSNRRSYMSQCSPSQHIEE